MTDIAPLDILQWVLLVLLAGFIGQFGKTVAQALMARMRRKSAASDVPSRPGGSSGSAATDGPGPQSGTGRPDGIDGLPERPAGLPPPDAALTTAADGTDKKSVKALAKQQKKEAKLLSKRSK